MLEARDQDKIRSFVEHYGVHDVLVEVQVACLQAAARLSVAKRMPAAKRLEYIAALIERVANDDMVLDTKE